MGSKMRGGPRKIAPSIHRQLVHLEKLANANITKLDLKDGDILVCREMYLSNSEMENMINVISKAGHKNITILNISGDQELEILNEETRKKLINILQKNDGPDGTSQDQEAARALEER